MPDRTGAFFPGADADRRYSGWEIKHELVAVKEKTDETDRVRTGVQ